MNWYRMPMKRVEYGYANIIAKNESEAIKKFRAGEQDSFEADNQYGELEPIWEIDGDIELYDENIDQEKADKEAENDTPNQGGREIRPSLQRKKELKRKKKNVKVAQKSKLRKRG